MIAWSVLVIAVFANIAGYAFDLYLRWAWFDKVLHPYTIGAITLALALVLYGRVLTGATDHRLILILAIAAIGLSIGALWEVAEWGFDLFAPGNVIKGKDDTITDMIVDTLGTLLAGIWASFLVERSASQQG